MQEMKWQPIETCPDPNETSFIITDGRRVMMAYKNDDGCWMGHEYPDYHNMYPITPTHWMTLPALPASPHAQFFSFMEAIEVQTRHGDWENPRSAYFITLTPTGRYVVVDNPNEIAIYYNVRKIQPQPEEAACQKK